MFWSLILVVTIKYHVVIIRADNKGEGGVLALMALVNGTRLARGLSPRRLMIVLGIFGSALLYADGALTPAVTVMSAVEGLEIATPALATWVIPVTLMILVGLFLLQSRGTARIGALFGPVMLAWFATIGVLGLSEIVRQPGVLAAVSPYHAVLFFGDLPLVVRDPLFEHAHRAREPRLELRRQDRLLLLLHRLPEGSSESRRASSSRRTCPRPIRDRQPTWTS